MSYSNMSEIIHSNTSGGLKTSSTTRRGMISEHVKNHSTKEGAKKISHPYKGVVFNTAVIIPTLNEEKSIGRLINLLKKLYKDIKIIVVDDGSKDKTQEIVRKIKNVKLIDRSKKKIKGLTASVIDGVREVRYGNIVVIDADLQHPPQTIKEIVEKLKENDVVIAGRRSLPSDWPVVRKLISGIAGLLGRIRLLGKGFKVKDVVSGFFGVKTKLMQDILKKKGDKFEKQGYKVLFDLLKYCPKNTKVSEVYYDFQLRIGGSSKINKKHILIYLRSLFK